MKKQVLILLSVVFALSLAFTVFAFNQPDATPKKMADCCAKKDSCPMKNKQEANEKASCCDKEDCCCKGDSCPMKMNGEKSEGKQNCCKGDSCPMKKDAEKKTVSVKTEPRTVAAHSFN